MSDLIDRQAAIDAIDTGNLHRGIVDALQNIISELPSAEPERKRGRWIIDHEYIDCSICRREKWSRVPYENLVKRFRYCPNCGADMRGE